MLASRFLDSHTISTIIEIFATYRRFAGILGRRVIPAWVFVSPGRLHRTRQLRSFP